MRRDRITSASRALESRRSVGHRVGRPEHRKCLATPGLSVTQDVNIVAVEPLFDQRCAWGVGIGQECESGTADESEHTAAQERRAGSMQTAFFQGER